MTYNSARLRTYKTAVNICSRLQSFDIILRDNPQVLYNELNVFLLGKLCYTSRFVPRNDERRRTRMHGLVQKALQWTLLDRAYCAFLQRLYFWPAGRLIWQLRFVLQIYKWALKTAPKLISVGHYLCEYWRVCLVSWQSTGIGLSWSYRSFCLWRRGCVKSRQKRQVWVQTLILTRQDR